MNGFHPSTNFIGATGEYPIYEYINNTSNDISHSINNTVSNVSNILFNNLTSIKQLIDGTSNTKIDSSGLQVYHKEILNPFNNGWVNVESRLETDKNDIITIKANISGIDSTISTIEGEIVALQGEVATNTADIIANNGITTANTAAIVANGLITTANTIAITGLVISDGNSLKKANIDAGDIGLFQTIGGAFLNIVFNQNHFKDVAILATNREFNLNDEYANLPTTKNNKITWSSPLNYNTTTDMASVDLSNYLTSTQTSNMVFNNFITSNTFNNTLPNYVTNVSLSNQLYISSNSVNNMYISSNTFFNRLIPNYVTNTSLSNLFYISSNVASNILLNYVTNTALSNQLYISSNTVNNLLVSLSNTYISSNVLSTQLYTTQDIYTIEREYPPKLYNTVSLETTTTLLSKTVFTQTITLNTTGITYGSGDYIIYSSSRWTSNPVTTPVLVRSLLFDYTDDTYGAHWEQANYTPNGVYNKSNFIVSGYNGDWIILKLPVSIILTKYYFKDRNGAIARAPGEWKVYGSNDGIIFTEIIDASQNTRLISTDYINRIYTKTFSNTISYQYIGFTFNKLIGTSTGDVLNFSEIRLTGKEFIETSINPIYISSNVLPNILLPYENAIKNISDVSIINQINTSNYIQNTSNNFQHYLPKVITNGNIFLDMPLQISSNTQAFLPPFGKLPNASLLIGDGGRLLINGNYGGLNGSNFTRIGVANQSETRAGIDNTQINLYEKGYITYDAPSQPNEYGHLFNGNVRMSSLSIASQTVPNSNIRFEVGGSGSGANPFSIDVYGNITLNKVASANNLTLKAPLYFTVSQQATISGKTVYKYDLDLSLYTRYFQTLEGHKVRYFKITSIYSDGSALDGSQVQAYNYVFNNTFYMTDKSGLTMYCNDNWTNTQCEFIVNDIPINYWIRNSFDYITFINRLSIANNRKWYIIIQDYLS